MNTPNFVQFYFIFLQKKRNVKIMEFFIHYICQTCLVKQLLCPSGGQRCGHMEQFSASHCYQHPVLLSLKNNLKTNGFLTDNSAKAKCPVWGKGSKGENGYWPVLMCCSWSDALNYTTYNASCPSEQNEHNCSYFMKRCGLSKEISGISKQVSDNRTNY